MIPPPAENCKGRADGMVKEKKLEILAVRGNFSAERSVCIPREHSERKSIHHEEILTLALSALLTMGLLTACGGKTTDKTVDLTAFYNTLAEEYGWAEDAASSGEEDIMMMNLEGDMLEGSYPGLADVATKQLIAKAPMISAVVNEIVLAECGTEEDAATAASILQDRVDAQAEGGAWYPESMETWSNAQVVQNGTYVAMIATADHQEEIAEQFNALFA